MSQTKTKSNLQDEILVDVTQLTTNFAPNQNLHNSDIAPKSPPKTKRYETKKNALSSPLSLIMTSQKKKEFSMISGSASSSTQNKLYVINGTKATNTNITNSTWTNTVEMFDGVMTKWHKLPNPKQHRNFCAVAIDEISDQLFIIGGCQDTKPLQSVEVLDLTKMEWETLPNMIKQRSGCGAIFSNEKLIVVGGFDGKNFLSCMEILDFTQKKRKEWQLIQNVLEKPRAYFGITCTTLKDKLIIVGGCTGQTLWGYKWCSDTQYLEIEKHQEFSSTCDKFKNWKSAPSSGRCNLQFKDENIYAMIKNEVFIFDVKNQEWATPQNSTSTSIQSSAIIGTL